MDESYIKNFDAADKLLLNWTLKPHVEKNQALWDIRKTFVEFPYHVSLMFPIMFDLTRVQFRNCSRKVAILHDVVNICVISAFLFSLFFYFYLNCYCWNSKISRHESECKKKCTARID